MKQLIEVLIANVRMLFRRNRPPILALVSSLKGFNQCNETLKLNFRAQLRGEMSSISSHLQVHFPFSRQRQLGGVSCGRDMQREPRVCGVHAHVSTAHVSTRHRLLLLPTRAQHHVLSLRVRKIPLPLSAELGYRQDAVSGLNRTLPVLLMNHFRPWVVFISDRRRHFR